MRNAPITKQRFVYREIREDIVTGSLAPGTRLTLADLSQRFSVSPIPIREALRQLEQEGLIEMTPHVKIVVRGVTVEEAIWVAELRVVLEPPAAREAASHLSDADLTVLRHFFGQMEEHAAANEFESFANARNDFNEAFFARLPNERWRDTLKQLIETTRRYRNVIRKVDRLQESWAAMQRIMAALEHGDLDEVETSYRERREWSLRTLQNWAMQNQTASSGSRQDLSAQATQPAEPTAAAADN